MGQSEVLTALFPFCSSQGESCWNSEVALPSPLGDRISRKLLVASLLCLGAVAAVVWAIAGRGKVHYLPYYLPCPEIFSMKLQYTEEKLIQLFPQLFYQQPRVLAPNPSPQQGPLCPCCAFIPEGEGDFYYGGAVFGGLVEKVCELTRSCHMNIADKAKGIMAAWQEESHLNRHFFHKPSRVLSPENIWDDRKPKPPEIRLIRFSRVNKDYEEVRN
ncbi:LOW QUALITY PROTEIN: globoside alpha-1,3-N-acetylgalactosaminyltransferase 1 [Sylvia borin]